MILNLGEMLHPNCELLFLFTLNENDPSASTNPVTNQGFIPEYIIFEWLTLSGKKFNCLKKKHIFYGLYLRLIYYLIFSRIISEEKLFPADLF